MRAASDGGGFTAVEGEAPTPRRCHVRVEAGSCRREQGLTAGGVLNIIIIIRREVFGLNPTMLVCICKGLSEGAIQGVVESGATTVSQVGDACGAGTDCGTCQGAIEQLITEATLIRAR